MPSNRTVNPHRVLRDRIFHDGVANALRRNAAFLDVARTRLRRFIFAQNLMQPNAEWLAALSAGSALCLDTLTEPGENGDRRRQESPLPQLITEAQELQMLAAFQRLSQLPRAMTPRSENDIIAHFRLELDEETPQRGRLSGDAEQEYLLMRFAHSTFCQEEVIPWLRVPEPFLKDSTPIDVVLAGQTPRVLRAIHLIDRAEYVRSGVVVPESVEII